MYNKVKHILIMCSFMITQNRDNRDTWDLQSHDVKRLRLSFCPMLHGRAKRHRCQRFLCFSLAVKAHSLGFWHGLVWGNHPSSVYYLQQRIVSSPTCVEKQCVAPTGKQSIVLLNGTNSKMYFSLLKEGTPIKYKYIAVTVFRKPHNTVWGRHSCTWA